MCVAITWKYSTSLPPLELHLIAFPFTTITIMQALDLKHLRHSGRDLTESLVWR